MKEFKLLTERNSYTARTSIGKMSFAYIKDYVQQPLKEAKEFFGLTLEDTVRPLNIKVSKETGLPGGLKCKVRIYDSPKHGETLLFYTEDDLVTIKFGLLSWEYCETHGGNTHLDTDGCVLVAKNYISKDKIQGSMNAELVKIVKEKIAEGYEITAEFKNLPQLS